MRMFIVYKNKYLSSDTNIFGTCSIYIPLILLYKLVSYKLIAKIISFAIVRLSWSLLLFRILVPFHTDRMLISFYTKIDHDSKLAHFNLL